MCFVTCCTEVWLVDNVNWTCKEDLMLTQGPRGSIYIKPVVVCWVLLGRFISAV